MAWGELKRMIMDERARQQGIGRALLRTVETVALGNGVGLIRTEVGARGTSTHQPYRRAGYRDREPFGTHRPSSHSIFLEKQVSTAPLERACMDSKRWRWFRIYTHSSPDTSKPQAARPGRRSRMRQR